MKLKSVKVTFEAVDEIRHLPNSWGIAHYRQLLKVLDIDDADSYADADVIEMALMALQDHDAEEAMQIVLANFGDGHFSSGQRQNLCEELKEECAWEEYPNIEHQQALYTCVDLLSSAFPQEYPEPAACAVQLSMAASGLAGAASNHPLDAATLLRTVGRCQDQKSILNRFFSEQIGGTSFPEAESVIWHLEATIMQADTISVKFCGSAYWFRDLQEGDESFCDIDWPER